MQTKEQKISPIKQRILQFCATLGISKRDFYSKIGVSRGTLESSTGITEDVMAKFIATYSEINISWLITGEGTMLKNDAPPSEATVQPIYQPRSPEKKVDNQIINLYDFEATAGLRSLLDNRHANIIDTIKIPNMPKCDGAIHIVGDSMYPRLKPGDIIFYKKLPIDLQSILYGEMYLLSYSIDGDDYCVVKYIKRSDKGEPFITLASHNPAHEDTDIDFRCVNAIALIKGSYNQTTMS
jgi:transcriptional regulator